ncbi:MAG: DUF3991 and toprim domain-containing protein [Eubacteriales bacterium]|nr:DUF3991 and toprim domain-containing protein [Eubacteriales bacterium]
MAYIHFTAEQIEQAQSTDLVSFLQSRGETLKRSGSEYEWRGGGEKVTIRGNKWFHQYEREGGRAIDFVRRFYNLDFPDAVQMLIGNSYGVLATSAAVPHPKEHKPFELPEANSDMRRVYAYLLKQRFIDRDIIHHFTHNKMLYEDAEFHNSIFVGYDENGIPKHAHKRGTYGESSYKGNLDGSDADYSFHHTGTSNKLFVFEAPIDMLSFLTLYPKNWEQHSYVALCSVAEHAAVKMIKLNPNIKTVMLCLDHDKAGIEACYRIAENLHELGNYEVYRKAPTEKDWNEMLKAKNGIEPIPASEHPNMEHVRELCNELSEDEIKWSEEYEQLKRYPQKLLESTFSKLTDRIEKLKSATPDNVSDIQERTAEIARCALSFAVIRERQFGVRMHESWYADQMLSMYKPHHDKNGYKSRVGDMEFALRYMKEDYTADRVLTQSDGKEQIRRVLELGLDALRLNAYVSLQNPEQIESITQSM